MDDRVLLSLTPKTLPDTLALAARYPGVGIEVTTFAYPPMLDIDWQPAVHHYAHLVAPVRAAGGRITMHGPFIDLPAGTPDPLISAVCAGRYRHAIEIAAMLGAEIVVLHANFIGQILTDEYRHTWHDHSVAFWRPIAEIAGDRGVILAIENMWEYSPHLIGDVLTEIDHPALRACLDIGHAHLYGSFWSFDQWMHIMQPHLVHVHANNNDGVRDVHRALDAGVLNYPPLLEALRGLPHPPSITLEMDTVADMEDSLRFFHLPHPSSGG